MAGMGANAGRQLTAPGPALDMTQDMQWAAAGWVPVPRDLPSDEAGWALLQSVNTCHLAQEPG